MMVMSAGWTCSIAPGPPDWRVDWDAIRAAIPLLAPLGDCAQEPEFHAEGDVLTHTRMVCEAMAAMPAYRAVDDAGRRSQLFVAALLHDVAKPQCTEVDEAGRIRSPGHSLKGSHVARAAIYRADPRPLAAPFADREAIAGLVRYHGLPLNFLEKADPTRALLTASLVARCDDLAILAEADVRGRICGMTAELLDRVEMFREFARETNCFEGPRPFASGHARQVYFADGRSGPDYVPYDGGARCTVTMVCGLPGAGKDTYVRRHLANLPVISLDALRETLDVDPADDQASVVAAAKEQAREYLRDRRDLVWNATNVTPHLRRPLIELFTGYEARVHIVYVETAYATLIDRNARGRVPRRVIDRLIDKMDVPNEAEGTRVEWVIDQGSQSAAARF
jgi:predicted kinase